MFRYSEERMVPSLVYSYFYCLNLYTIRCLQSACRAIIAILADPSADSPLNCDAGNIIRCKDFRAYKSMVNMYCIGILIILIIL